jgi:very-short-patch-repair endonuclease
MDNISFGSLLRSQAGVFTRAQALAAGVSAHEATRAIAAREWVRVAGRGFTLAGGDIADAQLAWAAVLSMSQAVLWGPSALRLWRPDCPCQTPYMVRVAVPSGRRPQFRITPLRVPAPSDEETVLGGIRLQTLAAALVDSLASLPSKTADSLFSWAVTRKLISFSELEALVGRRARRPGAERLRVYLSMWRGGAASRAEVLFHVLMRSHAIVGWEPNASIPLPGYGIASVDALFRAAKLIVEIDGWAHHSSRKAFQRDRARQNALVQAGYRVLRFTWEDLPARPEHCVDQIRRALRGAGVQG